MSCRAVIDGYRSVCTDVFSLDGVVGTFGATALCKIAVESKKSSDDDET